MLVSPLHSSQIENSPSLPAQPEVQAPSLPRKGSGVAGFALRAGTERHPGGRNGSRQDPADHRALSLSGCGEGDLGPSSDRGSDEHHAELGVRIQAVLPGAEGDDVLRDREGAPSGLDATL